MRPDALFLPETVKTGGRIFDRIAAVCRIAEPLLQVNLAAGEKAYIRKQPHGRLFVTRDPADTIFFPIDHPGRASRGTAGSGSRTGRSWGT